MHDTRLDPLTTVPLQVREIARLFGVTPNAIRGRLRRLEIIPMYEDTSGARPVFFYTPRDIERLRVFDQPRLFLDDYEQSEIKFFYALVSRRPACSHHPIRGRDRLRPRPSTFRDRSLVQPH
ncbi:MerR family transcriptional regulator [Corynebacterium diphtheriae]|uniref:MerR family transcriptional regulator n=1 Tax=Corynebacterium diphtheriae TaxID=1717 RepID=UPI0011C360E2|nr:MerR family transcriptional regulator [Corynebacterium diphtheriae]